MKIKIIFSFSFPYNKVKTMKENVELFKKREEEDLLEERLSLH